MSALRRLLIIGLVLLAFAGMAFAVVAWAAPGLYDRGTASAGIKLSHPPYMPQGGMMQGTMGGHMALGRENSQAIGMMDEMMAAEDHTPMHDLMMKTQDHQVMHEAMDEMIGSEEHRAMHSACLSSMNPQQQ